VQLTRRTIEVKVAVEREVGGGTAEADSRVIDVKWPFGVEFERRVPRDNKVKRHSQTDISKVIQSRLTQRGGRKCQRPMIAWSTI
jgi:hypothetical protein